MAVTEECIHEMPKDLCAYCNGDNKKLIDSTHTPAFHAKYATRCTDCRELIEEGDLIVRSRDHRYRCPDCDSKKLW